MSRRRRTKRRGGCLPVILFFLVLAVAVSGICILYMNDMLPGFHKTDGSGDLASSDVEEEEVIDPVEKRAGEILDGMTQRDKICQLFIVTPEELTGVGTAIAAGETTRACLQEYPVGGLIYFSENLKDRQQTMTMIENSQQYAAESSGIPLFISIDEEGGTVARCADKLGTSKLEPMYSYREQGGAAAYENALTIARDISALGFNLDYAPVADVWSNPENRVIGTRAYSDDFTEAAELVSQAVKGFKEGGVLCSLKHFPGHGDTAEDSHKKSAYSYKTLEELRQQEFLPFISGIQAGADMVMASHITVPEVDSLPASLSSIFLTDILREELGFEGIIITDALAMSSIDSYYTAGDAAVKAFLAGNDLLLCTPDLAAAVTAMEEACASGAISEERLDESVMRILRLKIRNGIIK